MHTPGPAISGTVLKVIARVACSMKALHTRYAWRLYQHTGEVHTIITAVSASLLMTDLHLHRCSHIIKACIALLVPLIREACSMEPKAIQKVHLNAVYWAQHAKKGSCPLRSGVHGRTKEYKGPLDMDPSIM